MPGQSVPAYFLIRPYMSSEKQHEPGKPTVFHISVNGEEKKVAQAVVDYVFMVALAFPEEPTPAELVCKIMYTGPHKASGTLAQGQTVELDNGMKFDVIPTNRS
jgi:hypothetical protein